MMIQRSSFLRSLIQSSIASPFVSKLEASYSVTRAASSRPEISESSLYSAKQNEYADFDWDNLGFSFTPTDYMFMMNCSKDESFKQGQLCRYGRIELSPSAGVLNYGQVCMPQLILVLNAKSSLIVCCFPLTSSNLFVERDDRRDDGRLFLFRPDQNAIRMQIGAERMCMPAPSVEQFVDAVKKTALANKRWIPPPGKGSLYIRPILFGSGPILGLAPSPEYTFLIYASPVGNYFKEGTAPLNLYVEDEFHRASTGGAGGVKSITNYAPVLKAIRRAKDRGFSDVLYLDAANKKYIEEVSSCNIFIVKDNVLSTPAAKGTILEGVTRKSILETAHDLDYKVEERSIAVEELIDAEEVFCTGTAVGVAPVGSITYKGNRIEYNINTQMVSSKLYSRLVEIQKGTIYWFREL